MEARTFRWFAGGALAAYILGAALVTPAMAARASVTGVGVFTKIGLLWLPIVFAAFLAPIYREALTEERQKGSDFLPPSLFVLPLMIGVSSASYSGGSLWRVGLHEAARFWDFALCLGLFALGLVLKNSLNAEGSRSKIGRVLVRIWRPAWLLLTGVGTVLVLLRLDPSDGMIFAQIAPFVLLGATWGEFRKSREAGTLGGD